MRFKFGAFTVLLLFAICLMANINKYNVIFKKNTESDILGYKLWFFEGKDSTKFVWPDSARYVGFFSHDSLVNMYGDTLELIDVYPSEENGELLQAIVIAIDSSFNLSEPSFSKIYIKNDKVPPSRVSFVGGGIKE